MSYLLTLTTNLKTLRFKDFSENDPYVLKSVNNPDLNINNIDLQFSKRADDQARLFKMFLDRPGLNFIAKQSLLGILEYEGNPLSKVKKSLTNTAATVAGILAQASLSGTGFHFSVDKTTGNLYVRYNSFGNSKTIIPDNRFENNTVVSSLPNTIDIDIKENIKGEEPASVGYKFNPSGKTSTENVLNRIKEQSKLYDPFLQQVPVDTNFNLPTNEPVDTGYFGKHSSDQNQVVYESKTVSDVTNDLTESSRIYRQDTSFSTDLLLAKPLINDYLVVDKLDTYKDRPFTEANDRTPDTVDTYIAREYNTSYLTSDVHTIARVPKSNSKGKRYSGTVEGSDVLNSSGVSNSENLDVLDLIPFGIQIYEPGRGVPDNLYFRAYLESFNDTYSGEWNATKYLGRADSVYNYNGFKRDFNVSIKIAASSQAELSPLFNKLNYLVSSTGPSYSKTFMRGNFVKLTIGDYLYNVPGFFTSIDTSWSTNYPWEIGLGTSGVEDVQFNDAVLIVPHVLDVKLSFTPIHTFVPAYRQPFIGRGAAIDIAGEDLTGISNTETTEGTTVISLADTGTVAVTATEQDIANLNKSINTSASTRWTPVNTPGDGIDPTKPNFDILKSVNKSVQDSTGVRRQINPSGQNVGIPFPRR